MQRIRFVHIGVVIAAASLLPLASCSKKEESHSVVTSNKIIDIAGELDSEAPLLKRVPQQADGFFYWNASNEAHKRLLNSPWAKNSYLPAEEASFFETTKTGQMLKASGLSVENRAEWEKLITEAVIFTASSKPGDPALTLLFQSAKSGGLGEGLGKFKEQLKQNGIPVTDLTLAKGTGFSFDATKLDSSLPPDAQQAPILTNFAWDGQLVAVSTASWAIDEAFKTDGKSLPKVLSAPEFKERTRGFPNIKSRYAIGYFDIKNLLASLKATPALALQAQDLDKVPFQAVSFALAMDEAPSNYVRIAYQAADENQKKWFQALGASPSDSLVAVAPANPLLFLSIDGSTIKRVKELGLSQVPPEAAAGLSQQLTALDSLTRVGLFARLAPIGQSMLPVPDMMLIFESSNTAGVQAALTDLVNQATGASGMGGMTWQDKKIAEVPAKTMMSPLGFGAYLASTGNYVIIASTESQLQAVLESAQGKGQGVVLAKSLSQPMKDALSSKTLGNVYVDFAELGKFMENMTGVLSMYAPQNEDAKKLVNPQNIEDMKKMGQMVGAVTVEDGSINFNSFYQAPLAAKEVASAEQPPRS